MSLLLRSFFRGLLFVVPIGFTVWVLVKVFFWIDELIDYGPAVNVPGLGFALTIILITTAGVFGSLFLTRWVVKLLDRFATTEADLQLVIDTVQTTVDVMHLMYDDIWGHMQEIEAAGEAAQ